MIFKNSLCGHMYSRYVERLSIRTHMYVKVSIAESVTFSTHGPLGGVTLLLSAWLRQNLKVLPNFSPKDISGGLIYFPNSRVSMYGYGYS